MKTFDEVMAFTRTVSSNAAYEDNECNLLWAMAAGVREYGVILEVGCELGRSTTILAQVAKERHQHLICIDPFLTHDPPETAASFMRTMRNVGCPFTLYAMTTEAAMRTMSSQMRLDLLHLDGDHTTEGIETDCWWLLVLLRKGGYLCVHDYGRDSLPTVKPAIDRHVDGWESVERVGSLAVWRKP